MFRVGKSTETESSCPGLGKGRISGLTAAGYGFHLEMIKNVLKLILVMLCNSMDIPKTKPGMVVHACSLSYSGGQGKRIT
jgi:hypothetical protein